jgi:hypothetical protein
MKKMVGNAHPTTELMISAQTDACATSFNSFG